MTAYGSSFLWNVDRWIKAWIKLHGHHRSPGDIIMRSRTCLIFKVVFVFVSLSIRSWGHDLEHIRDKDGSFSVSFFFSRDSVTSRDNTHSLLVTSRLFPLSSLLLCCLLTSLSFSSYRSHTQSVPPFHTPMRCTTTLHTTHHTSLFSPWFVPGPPIGFCNWPCYTVRYHRSPTGSQHFTVDVKVNISSQGLYLPLPNTCSSNLGKY